MYFELFTCATFLTTTIFCIFFNSPSSPNTRAFCPSWIAGTKLSIHEKGLACTEGIGAPQSKECHKQPLVGRDRILFPPLYITLGLIKKFTKALDKDGACFTYLSHAFPGLTTDKLKAGISYGHHIRQLIRDPKFGKTLNEEELEAWKIFVLVKNLLSTRAGITQNSSWICWLLTETRNATRTSKCSDHSYLGVCFLRIWNQWATTRHQGHWDAIMTLSNSEERHPCRWGF